MKKPPSPVRALGLCSGGLDSILSALVLKRQGINVTWVSFETPFFSSEKAKAASEQTGIPLIVQNITPLYLSMLRNPNMGYGKNMNPCTDCHALMFQLAGEIMKKEGYHFLFSGEVAGQRPMSQRKSALRYVEKHSGMDGFIVRPLSARILPETMVEKEGLVDREQLLDLSGRSRKPQMALAGEWGVTDYPSPAGGCLLTDAGFSRRLRDLFDHEETIQESDLNLLKYGRHIRLSPQVKVIVGRNQAENKILEGLVDRTRQAIFSPSSFSGPRVILAGTLSDMAITKAAAICVGYSKVPPGEKGAVAAIAPGKTTLLSTFGTRPDELKPFIIC